MGWGASDEVITLYNSKIILSENFDGTKKSRLRRGLERHEGILSYRFDLMKVLRVKQIEDNMGKTLISGKFDANYFDMVNYSVFAMIHLS